MAKYIMTNKAVDDISEIWKYTFDYWSELQADKYYLMLLETCSEIAENPNIGKNMGEKLRSCTFMMRI